MLCFIPEDKIHQTRFPLAKLQKVRKKLCRCPLCRVVSKIRYNDTTALIVATYYGLLIATSTRRTTLTCQDRPSSIVRRVAMQEVGNKLETSLGDPIA